jgi:hypothetical protein
MQKFRTLSSIDIYKQIFLYLSAGEATPVTDDVDVVALQCRGRREKVRGEPIWTGRECVVVLTDDDGRRQCSGGNHRGGGVSGGRRRLGGHVGDGEGEELEPGHGRKTKRSEAPATSSNRWARREE